MIGFFQRFITHRYSSTEEREPRENLKGWNKGRKSSCTYFRLDLSISFNCCPCPFFLTTTWSSTSHDEALEGPVRPLKNVSLPCWKKKNDPTTYSAIKQRVHKTRRRCKFLILQNSPGFSLRLTNGNSFFDPSPSSLKPNINDRQNLSTSAV